MWDVIARKVEKTLPLIERRAFENINLIHLCTVYGVLSVAYYGLDKSYVSDGAYDDLCKYLLNNYQQCLDAQVHTGIIDVEMLQAGSGYHLSHAVRPTNDFVLVNLFNITNSLQIDEV